MKYAVTNAQYAIFLLELYNNGELYPIMILLWELWGLYTIIHIMICIIGDYPHYLWGSTPLLFDN